MGFWSDLANGLGALGKWMKHEHPANDVDTSGEGEPASGDSSKSSGDSTSGSGD